MLFLGVNFLLLRACLQCGVVTKLGALYIHSPSEKDQKAARTGGTSAKHHWHCERCASASLAALPPQTFCFR